MATRTARKPAQSIDASILRVRRAFEMLFSMRIEDDAALGGSYEAALHKMVDAIGWTLTRNMVANVSGDPAINFGPFEGKPEA